MRKLFITPDIMSVSMSFITQQEIAKHEKSFYRPISLVGGILANETDKLFSERKKKN
ncbi:hypothetical protein [Photorhabdus australis]|uniref:hypothetical protein n=1 Tax=Photorhabdus australis TaxID=286156 RepID=UPI000AB01C2E|nr:hypothetical protein [Photorhabdus australis]